MNIQIDNIDKEKYTNELDIIVENYYNLITYFYKCSDDEDEYLQSKYIENIRASLFTRIYDKTYEIFDPEIMELIEDDIYTIIDESNIIYETFKYTPDVDSAYIHVKYLIEDIEEYTEDFKEYISNKEENEDE